MARAYSDDLRRKFLEAHRRGEGSLAALAQRFGVSWGWAKKVSSAYSHTGRMERPPGAKRGRQSRLTPELAGHLRQLVSMQPDMTLAELQRRLDADAGVHFSVAWLWVVLGRMGLRLKKSRSTPPSGTPKRPVNGGKPGTPGRGRSRRKD